MDLLEKMVVLIDADNTQIKKLEAILQEISTFGRIVVKRAYGNWKKSNLKCWENEIKRLAIKAEQQFDYVKGKNATDMALVIDAIELLNSRIYDGFIIVSSDSDYTPLAIKLHESGVYVIGVGEHKTPESFRNSCDQFVFIENLIDIPSSDTVAEKNSSYKTEAENDPESSGHQKNNEIDNTRAGFNVEIQVIHSLLKKAWKTYQDDDEYVNISAVGSYIKRVKPDFDVRSFGFPKITEFIKAFPKMYNIKKYPGKGTVTIVAYKCI